MRIAGRLTVGRALILGNLVLLLVGLARLLVFSGWETRSSVTACLIAVGCLASFAWNQRRRWDREPDVDQGGADSSVDSLRVSRGPGER
jgi:hypothetical protein